MFVFVMILPVVSPSDNATIWTWSNGCRG